MSSNWRQRSRGLRRVVTPWDFKETWVNRLLPGDRPTTYLEIGVRWGESLRVVTADRKIGIDPNRHPALGTLRPGEEFFQTTSDEFFAKTAPAVIERGSVDVALVDGLHECRQALRDVLHLEPYMAPGGVVVLDDCNPGTAAQGGEEQVEGAWNGDVWKTAMLLRHELDDLTFVTVDGDNGIGLLWGFTGRDEARSLDASTVDRYKALRFEAFDADRRSAIGLHRPSSRRLRRLGLPL